MTNPYIAQDVLDQAAEALRQGKTLECVASRLQCSPEHLSRLLGLPALQPAAADQDPGIDLWRVDQDVL